MSHCHIVMGYVIFISTGKARVDKPLSYVPSYQDKKEVNRMITYISG